VKIELGELRKIIREEIFEPEKGLIPTNSIRYGHAPIEFVKLARKSDDRIKEWFIRSGWAEKIQGSAPTNDGEVTKRDLEKLLKLTREATQEDVAFSKFVDDESNIAELFLSFLSENGYEESLEEYYRIDNQTLSLLFYLKEVIDRPRPYQLARHFGLPIYPLIRTDAMTASYPSGHALVGFVMSEYYSRKYPRLSIPLRSLGKKIAFSREVVAIHYPSDTKVSRLICDIIFQNDLLE
jgi:hypothetical protein